MNVRVENVSVASLAATFLLGAIVGYGASFGVTYHVMNQKVVAAEAATTTATNLLTRAECPENVFQEKTIMLPDGGVYKCGAVRTIPVNQRELNKWYKAEAKLLLKKKGKK